MSNKNKYLAKQLNFLHLKVTKKNMKFTSRPFASKPSLIPTSFTANSETFRNPTKYIANQQSHHFLNIVRYKFVCYKSLYYKFY